MHTIQRVDLDKTMEQTNLWTNKLLNLLTLCAYSELLPQVYKQPRGHTLALPSPDEKNLKKRTGQFHRPILKKLVT
jgi:hypothetical protein